MTDSADFFSPAHFDSFLAETARIAKPARFESRLGGRYISEFASAAPKREWIVKNALLARTLSLVIGPGGCGKSFLALDLAMTLALAAVDPKHPKTWFRRKITPCGVVYVSGEGQDDFIFRMRAWLSAKGLPLDMKMPVVLIPTALDLRSEQSKTKELLEEVKARSMECMTDFGVPIGLQIIDTVSTAMAGGDDVKPEHIGAFFRNCRTIQSECSVATLAIHHTPKGGKLEARGHGSVSFDNDGEWTVEGAEGPKPNCWRIKRIKAAPTGDRHEFRLRRHVLGTDEDGEDVTSQVVIEGGYEKSEEASVQSSISESGAGNRAPMTADGRFILADNITLALKALQSAIDRPENADAPESRAPFGTKAVKLKDWKAEIARVMTADDKTTDAFRKRVERAFEQAGAKLSRRGFIEIDGDIAWRTRLRVASVDTAHSSGSRRHSSEVNGETSGAKPLGEALEAELADAPVW